MYELLLELKERLTQLAIVGLGYIPEDFRLKKLEEKLKALSSKAPVLAKLYELVVKLLEGEEVEAHYIELNSLVDAILNTQANSKPQGEEQRVALYDYQDKNTLTFTQLQEIRAILQGKTSAKWASLKEAYKEGKLLDLRLLEEVLENIGDSYEYIDYYDEVPEEQEKNPFSIITILEQYGKGIIPILLERFEGYKPVEKVNAIKILSRLSGGDYNDLYKKWAESEEKEAVVAAALSALGALEENKGFLLEFKTKKKKLQEARIMALAEILQRKGKEELGTLVWDENVLLGKEMTEIREYCSKNVNFFVQVFRTVPFYNDIEMTNLLLETAQKINEDVESSKLLLEADQEVDGDEELIHVYLHRNESYHFFRNMVYLLDYYRVETVLETVQKLMAFNEGKGKLCFEARIGTHLLDDYLQHSRYPECRLFLAGLKEQYNGYYLTESFLAALKCYDAKKLYDEFSPLVTKKHGKVTTPIIEMLKEVHKIDFSQWEQSSYSQYKGRQYITVNGNKRKDINLEEIEWDSRWFKFAYGYGSERLMMFFLLRGTKEEKRKDYKQYYIEKLEVWKKEFREEEGYGGRKRTEYLEEVSYLILGLCLTGAKEEAVACVTDFANHLGWLMPVFYIGLTKDDLMYVDELEKQLDPFNKNKYKKVKEFISEIRRHLAK